MIEVIVSGLAVLLTFSMVIHSSLIAQYGPSHEPNLPSTEKSEEGQPDLWDIKVVTNALIVKGFVATRVEITIEATHPNARDEFTLIIERDASVANLADTYSLNKTSGEFIISHPSFTSYKD